MAKKNMLQDTIPTILIHGLPEGPRDRAMNTVAKQYGFRYYRVAGCVVPRHLDDSVIKENKITYQKLSDRFGINWKRHFAEQVDTMYDLQMQVESLVRKEPHIIIKQLELEKKNNVLYFRIDPVGNNDQFTVLAYAWGNFNGEDGDIVYFKMLVDLNKNTISSIRSTYKQL